MAIDRAPWNALVDDDGSNLVGTIWNKASIKTVLLDPTDAALLIAEGVWVDAPVNPADFTTASGSWTITAPAVSTFAYRLSGKTLQIAFYVTGSTIAGAPTSLDVKVPAGYVIGGRSLAAPFNYFNGAVGVGWGLAASGTTIKLYKDILGTAWTAGTAHVTFVLSAIVL